MHPTTLVSGLLLALPTLSCQPLSRELIVFICVEGASTPSTLQRGDKQRQWIAISL